MLFRTVVDMILSRAQDLGLKGESGQVDGSTVELALLHTVQRLADSWDFDTLTQIANPMFTTGTGEDTYRLPEDFGRLLFPQDDQESGVFIYDGTNEQVLVYRDPFTFYKNRSTTNQRPAYFTLLTGKQLRLDPPPDSNGTNAYRGRGVYSIAITEELLEGEVPLAQPAALVDMTVAALAVDKSHANQAVLLQQGEIARSRIVNANARMRQQFQSKHGRTWRHTRVR